MSNIAIATNVALLLFTSKLFENTENDTRLLIFILAEHFGLGLKYWVEHLVDDIPSQLVHLNDRHKYIGQAIFKGFVVERGDDKLRERAEKLHLLIEPNPNWEIPSSA